jgi:hypothetical protein
MLSDFAGKPYVVFPEVLYTSLVCNEAFGSASNGLAEAKSND